MRKRKCSTIVGDSRFAGFWLISHGTALCQTLSRNLRTVLSHRKSWYNINAACVSSNVCIYCILANVTLTVEIISFQYYCRQCIIIKIICIQIFFWNVAKKIMWSRFPPNCCTYCNYFTVDVFCNAVKNCNASQITYKRTVLPMFYGIWIIVEQLGELKKLPGSSNTAAIRSSVVSIAAFPLRHYWNAWLQSLTRLSGRWLWCCMRNNGYAICIFNQ